MDEPILLTTSFNSNTSIQEEYFNVFIIFVLFPVSSTSFRYKMASTTATEKATYAQ